MYITKFCIIPIHLVAYGVQHSGKQPGDKLDNTGNTVQKFVTYQVALSSANNETILPRMIKKKSIQLKTQINDLYFTTKINWKSWS